MTNIYQSLIRKHCNEISDIIIDDDLASLWAKSLHNSIEIEEIERNKEDLRPLAYKLIPEVWKRLRPTPTDGSNEDDKEVVVVENETKNKDAEGNNPDENENTSIYETEDMVKLTCKNMRLSLNVDKYELNWYDTTHEIVYKCLYNQFPNFHVSCGAKFGCDYLIYDGCRMERHAFAGLRILTAPEQNLHNIIPKDGSNHHQFDDDIFPSPKPYDLAGYVRCLNTAGKLALVALVVKAGTNNTTTEDQTNVTYCKYHVAIVDLALEKVATAQAHIRKRVKKDQLRKAIGLHWAKNTSR